MSTEDQNPKTLELDTMSIGQILHVMNEEDKNVAFAVQTALPQIEIAVEATVTSLRKGGRLIYLGAGTSGRNEVLDAVECVPTFGTSPDLIQGLMAGGQSAFFRSIEGAEDDRAGGQRDLEAINLQKQDIVVGIAASGRTPYVLGAIAYAQSIGCTTVGISNNQPTPLLDEADIPVALLTGAEVLSGSTRLKAGTAQKMVLNMISTATMVKLGKVYNNLMVDVRASNEKLRHRAKTILMTITDLDDVSASELLAESNGEVKVAIVMHHEKISFDEAIEKLKQVDGHLHLIIG